MRYRTFFTTTFLCTGFGLVWVAWAGLADVTPPVTGHDIAFQSSADDIIGTLVLPDHIADGPIAMFVHGDGPQDRWSNNGYAPMMHHFLAAGIGVFSWDKPGIGQSSGDWLADDMAARSDRVLDARAALIAAGIAPERIGIIGFSQAGWVVPRANATVPFRFTVLVGVAVDWQDQGDYFERIRLERDGVPLEDIPEIIAAGNAADDLTFAVDAQTPPDGMTEGRFAFVKRNRASDASADIGAMTGPVLAIWGARDANVDPQRNAAAFRDALNPNDSDALIWPEATHGLLRAAWYDYQKVSEWPAHEIALFAVSGRKAYAVGALDAISDFINATADY